MTLAASTGAAPEQPQVDQRVAGAQLPAAQAASSAARYDRARPSVAAEAQPQAGPSVSTRSSPAIPAPSRTAPATSSRRLPGRAAGRTSSPAARASALRPRREPERRVEAQGLGEQPDQRVADADAGGSGDADHRDRRPRAVRGQASRATAVASGTRPSPTPCSARPARNTANPVGSADSTQPASITATAPSDGPAAQPPVAEAAHGGVATAPASSVMVSVHCERGQRDVLDPLRRSGSSGVPRLATAVDWTARNTSVAASRRGETRRREAVNTVPR